MKLLLTSAGLTNPTIVAAFEQLNGKPLAQSRLAFIPTAANVESGSKDWLITDLNNCEKTGLSVDIVDFSAVPKDIWLPRLKEADILLFSGGNTYYLAYCLEKFEMEPVLRDLLSTRVYVGISAGSMVAAKTMLMNQSAHLYSETFGELTNDRGLGLVNFHIRPHLNSPFFPQIRTENLAEKAKETTGAVYALDDDSAMVVDGDSVKVVSEGKWHIFNN